MGKGRPHGEFEHADGQPAIPHSDPLALVSPASHGLSHSVTMITVVHHEVRQGWLWVPRQRQKFDLSKVFAAVAKR